MRNIPQEIEDRIARRSRRGRRIRIGSGIGLHYGSGRREAPGLTPMPLVWSAKYIESPLVARTGVNTAITVDTLTVGDTDSGTGTYDVDLKQFTATGESYTVDEWAGFSLKVDNDYFLIISNTSNVLTLDVAAGTFIADTTFNIVAFPPGHLIGAYLRPDSNDATAYRILRNTESVITVQISIPSTFGNVTSGDDLAPYDTFTATAHAQFPNNHWTGRTLLWSTGNNIGESRSIVDFIQPTSTFILESGNTNPINSGDEFELIRSMLNVPVGATWSLEHYYPIGAAVFDNAAPGSIKTKRMVSQSGELIQQHLENNFAGLYTVDVFTASKRSPVIALSCVDSIRIELHNLSTGEQHLIHTSGLQPNQVQSVVLPFERNTWHRVLVYFYARQGSVGFQLGSFSDFIQEWRLTVLDLPIWVSVSGGTSGGAEDFATQREDSIELIWTNSVFIDPDSVIEIWKADTETGTYTFVDALPAVTTNYSYLANPNVEQWFKLRYRSGTGFTGAFTEPRVGHVMSDGVGNTTIIVSWENGAEVPVLPNLNGWLNPPTLKAKITVESELIIQSIFFTPTGDPLDEENAGPNSPVSKPNAGLVESDSGSIAVKVRFTNGAGTDWQWTTYKYDKTIPTAPVWNGPAHRVENFEIILHLGAYTHPSSGSGHWKFDWHWDTDNTAPATDDSDVMRISYDHILFIGQGQFDADVDTVYVWVRTVDLAGNVSAWVATTVDMTIREVTGLIEIKDLFEFS